MKFIDTEIEGVKLIQNNKLEDKRGSFLKIFNDELFKDSGIQFEIKESYYSVSNENVIRGMHFQLPPYAHGKLVNVINGKIKDMILDLRPESKTYKKYLCIELSDENNMSVYIPKGCAHGFKALVGNTIVMYNVSTIYNSKADCGVKWNSFGANWECNNPIVSDRDNGFKSLEELEQKF